MVNGKGVDLREGNISLILDSYDDIFSDFDPRPYSEKALSTDFLEECKRATKEKEDVELRLLVPKQRRNPDDETKIKKRLKQHFQKHLHEKSRKIRNIRRVGFIWVSIGVLLMFAATFFYKEEGFMSNLLFIMTEPAGWFLFWEGAYKLFITSKENAPDYEFYKKMETCRICFLDY